MIYTLDKYQTAGLELIENSSLLVLHGNKSSGKSYLLRYYIYKLWKQGKKALVIVPDTEKANLFQKHLGAFDLIKYSIILDSNENLSQKNIAKIRSLYKEEKIEITKTDLNVNKLLYDTISSKLYKHYGILNKKLLGEQSFNDLIIINSFDKRAFENIYFNQIIEPEKFSFNLDEYNTLKANIKTAFELQAKGKNDIDVYFSKKAYQSNSPEKSWNKIKIWIENSRIQTLKAIQYISGFLQEQSFVQFEIQWNKTKEITEEAEKIITTIGKFNLVYEDFDPDQSAFFGLDKQVKQKKEEYQLALQKIRIEYKNLINKLSSIALLKNHYTIPDSDEEEPEKILISLQKLIDDTEIFEKIIQVSIKKELKSMNFRNIKNDSLDLLQQELTSLFELLNNGYAIKQWEDNAFSINKQLIFLENLLHDLNLLEGQKYNFLLNFEWNKFLHSLDDKSLYIIKILNIYQPKNWLIFFKNWFVQNLIFKYKHYLNDHIDRELINIYQVNEKKQHLEYIKSAKIWQNKREILLNNLSDKSNQINRIFSQTNIEVSIDDLYEENDEFLSTFFPVQIIPVDSIKNLPESILSNYEVVVFENADEYKNEIGIFSKMIEGKKKLIAIDDNDNLVKINEALINANPSSKVEHFEIKGSHQQGMINLLDMNYTERLYAARNIAHLMQTANSKIKIYQIKGIVIFSALDEILNKVLFKILENTGIKEMKIIDTPFHLLVDNLLEVNNKQILITQNHLLNYHEYSEILWQLNALEKIRKAGLKIVNFNTSQLFDKPVKTIKEFISKNIV